MGAKVGGVGLVPAPLQELLRGRRGGHEERQPLQPRQARGASSAGTGRTGAAARRRLLERTRTRPVTRPGSNLPADASRPAHGSGTRAGATRCTLPACAILSRRGDPPPHGACRPTAVLVAGARGRARRARSGAGRRPGRCRQWRRRGRARAAGALPGRLVLPDAVPPHRRRSGSTRTSSTPPTDRQTDFTASGGPGLEIVRPIGKKSRFRLDGAVDYLWFARTESQRKLNGHGSALLDLQGVKTRFAVEERYATSYARPNYEVNERVQQETEGTEGILRRRLGERFELAVFGSRRTHDHGQHGLPRHGPRPHADARTGTTLAASCASRSRSRRSSWAGARRSGTAFPSRPSATGSRRSRTAASERTRPRSSRATPSPARGTSGSTPGETTLRGVRRRGRGVGLLVEDEGRGTLHAGPQLHVPHHHGRHADERAAHGRAVLRQDAHPRRSTCACSAGWGS